MRCGIIKCNAISQAIDNSTTTYAYSLLRKTMTDAPVPAPTASKKPDLLLPIILVCMAVVSGIISWRIWLMYRPTSTPVTLPTRQKTQSVELTSSTPTVAPTPDTGPGNYVCDSLGICNIYEDPQAAGCTTTFADPHCLNQCHDVSKRCPAPKKR